MNLVRKVKNEIIKTHIFNLITARFHQKHRRKELDMIVGELVDKYKDEEAEKPEEKVSDYIWVCWWQGENDMSPIVRECYKRICRYNQDKRVILITEENLDRYVCFPEYILQKYEAGIITKTHFSDLLRAELLAQYGGVWMDITLLTHSAVPNEFYDYPVYTGRYLYDKSDYNVSQNRWTSYFWVSRYANNILFRYLSDFWRIYWKEKNDLIEYLLIDYALDYGYRNIPTIKKELNQVPINGCGKNVWQLLKILHLTYDEMIIKEIKNSNWMQKLSYNGENDIQIKAESPENSVYKYLFLDANIE